MNYWYEKKDQYVPYNGVNAGTSVTEQGQFRPIQYAGDLTERARFVNEHELREMLRQAFCGLDTCSLLCLHKDDVAQSERRQEYFLSTVRRLCEEERVAVFTSLRVYQELLELEERGDRIMKIFAQRALNWIRHMNAKGLMLVSDLRSVVRVNADQELFMICSEEYLRNPVCIFTQDGSLAQALLRQNENRMMPHFEIMVRRVNMRGCMAKFAFDSSADQTRVEQPLHVVRDLHAPQSDRGGNAGCAWDTPRRTGGQTRPASEPRLKNLRAGSGDADTRCGG